MKRCKGCGEEKSEDDFYRYKSGALFSRCKPCIRQQVRTHQAANREYFRAYDRKRYREDPGRQAAIQRSSKAFLEAHPERKKIYTARSRAAHPEKYKARTAVGNALRDGRLQRGPCEKCGAAKVEAHHEDYSKPLEVRWLCSRCHGHEHRTVEAG